jgi:hypothetical protein
MRHNQSILTISGARRAGLPILLLSLFAGLGLTPSPARAQDSSSTGTVPGMCSLATVKGSYGVLANGTIVGVGLATASGIITTDGNGHFVYRATQNIGGTVNSFIVTGTYTLNADCSGVATYANGYTYTAVVVQGGTEIYFQSTTTSPSIIETAVAKRL